MFGSILYTPFLQISLCFKQDMHFDEDFIRILSLVKRINVAVIGDVFFLRCRGLPNKPLCNAKTGSGWVEFQI